MITINQFKEIKKLQLVGTSQKEISEKLGISIYAIKKWWDKTEEDFLSVQAQFTPYLDKYRQFIVDQLKLCPQIRTTNLLFKLSQHFDEFAAPGKNTFFRYIRKLREELGLLQFTKKLATARETTLPAELAQVDFGQMRLQTMYDTSVKVYFFCMVLPYSNFRFVYFESKPFTTETAIKAHNYAFKFFGGRPQKIMYDLDRVFVQSENYGDIVFVKKFEEYARKIGFSVLLCHAYSPMEKSKVEILVNKVKKDFLTNHIYTGICSLNMQCLKWLDMAGNERILNSLRGVPVEVFVKEEQSHLIPVCGKLLEDKQRVFSGIKSNNAIKYSGKLYELPLGTNLIMSRVQVEEVDGELHIFCTETGDEICRHKISKSEGLVVKLKQEVEEKSSVLIIKSHFIDDELFERYFEKLKSQEPRYLPKQSIALLRTTRHYTTQQLHEAFVYCLNIGNCRFTQLMAFLIHKHGIEVAKKFLSREKVAHYSKKAKELEVSGDGE